MTATIRAGVNARMLHARDLRGWNRYAVNLLAALPSAGVELVLYTDRPVHPDHLARLPEGSYEVKLGAVRPYTVWEQVWLPRRCDRDRVDVLHAPANFGLPWSSPCPRVLTLHDAIDRVYYAPRATARERWGPRSLLNRASHWVSRTKAERVIAVSGHARADLIDALGVPADKIRVIHSAADPAMHRPVAGIDRARVRQRFGLGRPFVFYVGGWEGRKNLPFLVRAFAASGLEAADLVLAGGRDGQRAGLAGLAESLGVGERVKLLGWVEDDDLPALYASALAFAYPSEYEGFGLQLVEALALGCPALAARATCLPEVLGRGGETFSLSDPAELAGLLRRLACEPGFRDDLVRRARERSADFSWARTAGATADVYRELADLSAPRGRPCAPAARS